jgi:hypothetical protein
MKYTFSKATFISVLLFISAISCPNAGEINPPAVKNDNVNPQIEISKIPKEAATDPTIKENGLLGQRKSRAIGNALLKHNNNPSDDTTELKKRIEELEIIVKEQNKLIEIYKTQNE